MRGNDERKSPHFSTNDTRKYNKSKSTGNSNSRNYWLVAGILSYLECFMEKLQIYVNKQTAQYGCGEIDLFFRIKLCTRKQMLVEQERMQKKRQVILLSCNIMTEFKNPFCNLHSYHAKFFFPILVHGHTKSISNTTKSTRKKSPR